MTPYYQDDLVTLYHADSRSALPAIDIAPALIVTDPPYGIDWRQHGGGRTGKSRNTKRYDGIAGDVDTSVRDDVLARYWDTPAAVFGSFRAPFPTGVRQVLIYQKSPDAGVMGSVTGFRTDVEPIFLLGRWPPRDAQWSSVLRTDVALSRLRESGHPHAKPIDVLVRLIEAGPVGTVLDPFAGSGSTLVAAKVIGRKAIGLEVDERWCERAAQRCSQDVLGLTA